MESLHFIRDVAFDISFDSEAAAFEHHTRLGSFVSERLMAVADEVFSRVATDDGSTVRIDNLEIDLGRIPARTYYENAEERFRERLSQALRHKLLELNGVHTRVAEAQEGTLSSAERELEIVSGFLERGYLPWNVRTLSGKELEAMLRRSIADAGPQLAARLRATADRDAVEHRIAWQFPPDLANALANAVAETVTGATEPARRDNYPGMQALLERAVESGRADPLRHSWPDLFENNSELVERVVRRLGIREDVRRAMARGFPDPVLAGIAGVLEPGEIGFIEEVTGRPELFREVAKERRESWPETKARVWEFTFAYLLTERGSQFNRRAYLASVTGRMAAHYNMSFEDMIVSLAELLRKMEVPSALRAEMLALLAALGTHEEENADADADEATAAYEELLEPWIPLFEAALSTGDAMPLSGIWPEVVKERRRTIEEIVRRRGVDADVRHAMAFRFPLPMLRTIAGILEPAEIGFIEEVAERPELFARAATDRRESPPVLRRALWEFTFTYLLAERGSRFNRRSYVASMVRQMAARENRDYRVLLASLGEVLEEMEVPSGLRTELLSLLGELSAEAVGEPEASAVPETAPDWEERLEAALTAGDARPLGEAWREWVRDRGDEVARTIRRVGRAESVRHAMAFGLPLPMLQQIGAILEPSEISLILELTDSPAVFQKAAAKSGQSIPATGRWLWEFTLTYLVVDRGSLFNRRSYTSSVVRRIAAHENLKYEDLVLSLTAVLEELGDSGPLKKMLYEILADASAAAPASPGLNLPADREALLEEAMRMSADAVSAEAAAGSICELAEYRSLRAADLMRFLILELERLINPTNRQQQLLGWLRQANRTAGEDDEQAPQTAPAEQKTPGAADAIRSCELFDVAAAFLFGGQPMGAHSEDPRRALEELRHEYSSLYGRIASRVRALGYEGSVEAWIAAGRPGAPAALWDRDLSEREIAEEALEDFLARADRLSPEELSMLVRMIDRQLIHPTERFLSLLRDAAEDSERMRILSAVLPTRQLARMLLFSAEPGWHHLLRAADAISEACDFSDDAAKWQFLFAHLAQRRLPATEKAFASAFIAWIAQRKSGAREADLRALAVRRLRSQTGASAAPVRRRILAALETPAQRKPAPAAAPLAASRSIKTDAAIEHQHIYVRNAGQVLAGPYLPRLFTMLGLLEDNRFRDSDAVDKGIHLLQYMVDETLQPPEHLLPLNKVLCGVDPARPVRRDIELTQAEKDAVNGMLQAIVAHWTAIGNTSVTGLRESFLQREGRLRLAQSGWQLLVQPRAFDMLLDRLPWSFRVIRHPWMNEAVYVEWR